MNDTIQCEKFGCLVLIQNVLEEKLKNEPSERIVKQFREAYDCLPIYFRVHKRNPLNGEHYEKRIRAHIKEIMDYVCNGYVKPRLLKEEMTNTFPMY